MDIWSILDGKRHPNYIENVEYSEKLMIHSTGKNISRILNKYRPNEAEFIKKYRDANARRVTTSYWKKATDVVRKSQRAAGIDIQFPDGSEKTVAWSIENKIQNRLFSEFLPLILEDPRCVFLVLRDDFEQKNKESEVKVYIFRSSQVFYVDETNLVAAINSVVYWFDFASSEITGYAKNEKGEYKEISNHEGLEGSYFYGGGSSDAMSFFDAAVDFWFEALVQYSDLQGSIKSHAFPLPVVMQVQQCGACNGVGHVFIDDKKQKCSSCRGSGYVSSNPYTEIQANAQDYKDFPQLPWPPVIYPQRDLEPIRLLKEEYEANINRGLESINMEFLSNVGANQSGIAKVMDRDELNGALYSWVNHLYNYLYYNIIRFAGIYVQGEEVITHTILPDGFDVYGIEAAEESLKRAREAKVPNNLLRVMESDYIRKKYEGRPKDQAFNDDLISFDFTYGLQPEQVEIQLLNGGMQKLDYQMSVNLYFLLKKAYATVDGFWLWDFMKKYDWLISETSKKNIPNPTPEM